LVKLSFDTKQKHTIVSVVVDAYVVDTIVRLDGCLNKNSENVLSEIIHK